MENVWTQDAVDRAENFMRRQGEDYSRMLRTVRSDYPDLTQEAIHDVVALRRAGCNAEAESKLVTSHRNGRSSGFRCLL